MVNLIIQVSKVKDLGYKNLVLGKIPFEPMTDQAFEIFWEIFLVTVVEFVSSLRSKAYRELQQFCVVFSIYSG